MRTDRTGAVRTPAPDAHRGPLCGAHPVCSDALADGPHARQFQDLVLLFGFVGHELAGEQEDVLRDSACGGFRRSFCPAVQGRADDCSGRVQGV
ncbi:hypothetical protein ABT010_39535 [Streptomyces sp. NPDC002668]|uniref:hypothetical protein n=1 Tax=Streptomyces sp. NPDC002668 TaxID=3154422 RepID=UPI00332B30BB